MQPLPFLFHYDTFSPQNSRKESIMGNYVVCVCVSVCVPSPAASPEVNTYPSRAGLLFLGPHSQTHSANPPQMFQKLNKQLVSRVRRW